MNQRLYFLFPNTARAIKLMRDFKQQECQYSDAPGYTDKDDRHKINPLCSQIEGYLQDMVFAIFILELSVIIINEN